MSRSTNSSESPQRDPLLSRALKGGEYRLLSRIGEGGMGVVYCGEHTQLGKQVAIKTILLTGKDTPIKDSAIRRFIREAKLVAKLEHENIARVFDLWQEQEGYFMAMELVPGSDLEDIIAKESPIAPKRAMEICLQVANALSIAEKRHIVHQDIKPSNIRIQSLENSKFLVKVLDFGIALPIHGFDTNEERNRITQPDSLMGTPLYVAPEQLSRDFADECLQRAMTQEQPAKPGSSRKASKSKPRHEVDTRADLYSLGIVLYEMLTGGLPFKGDGAVSARLFREAPLLPDGIPVEVRAIVEKLLKKSPFERYQSTSELIADLEQYLERDSHSGLARNGGASSERKRPGRSSATTLGRERSAHGQALDEPQRRWRRLLAPLVLLLVFGVALLELRRLQTVYDITADAQSRTETSRPLDSEAHAPLRTPPRPPLDYQTERYEKSPVLLTVESSSKLPVTQHSLTNFLKSSTPAKRPLKRSKPVSSNPSVESPEDVSTDPGSDEIKYDIFGIPIQVKMKKVRGSPRKTPPEVLNQESKK